MTKTNNKTASKKSATKTAPSGKKKSSANNTNSKRQPKAQTQKKPSKTKVNASSTPELTTSNILSRITSYEDIQKGRVFQNPSQVQLLLDALPYNTDDLTRCPAEALKAKKVHCFDGALLACACLKGMRYPEFGIVYINAVDDDGHALCVFKSRDGKSYGAIGKSNFAGLRYRDPVYPDVRTLVWSYFDSYFNIKKKRTMRGFTKPIKLTGSAKIEKMNWEFDNDAVPKIENLLYEAHEFQLLKKGQEKNLTLVDERSATAGMTGIDLKGCYGAKE